MGDYVRSALCPVCHCEKIATRGVCLYCYSRYRHRGRHVELPRMTWSGADLVREADILLGRGLHKEDVAKKLGVKWSSIVTARWRLRRRAQRRREQ